MVVGLSEKRVSGLVAWECNCDCGSKGVIVPTKRLRNGDTSSCGCLRSKRKVKTGRMTEDLTGKKFNLLTAIKFDEEKSKIRKQNFWLCKCDCGNSELVSVNATNLRKGYTKGCCACKDKRLKIGNTKHGMKYTRIYRLWRSMKSRCYYPKINGYENYGGRGIKVCDDWQKFEPFYNWAMDNGYSDDLTIDRIDVDGDYEPSNCQWISSKQQMRNMQNTIYVNYKNKEYVLLDLLEELGREEEYNKIRSRIRRGWEIEEALESPFNMQRNHYYFVKGLYAEFKENEVGHKINKSDFIEKYIDKQYNSRFATYANSDYIQKTMKQLGIKNNRFYIEKVEGELINENK